MHLRVRVRWETVWESSIDDNHSREQQSLVAFEIQFNWDTFHLLMRREKSLWESNRGDILGEKKTTLENCDGCSRLVKPWMSIRRKSVVRSSGKHSQDRRSKSFQILIKRKLTIRQDSCKVITRDENAFLEWRWFYWKEHTKFDKFNNDALKIKYICSKLLTNGGVIKTWQKSLEFKRI